MIAPVAVTRSGHRTFLKWHRARRRASDPVFTGRRILDGLALGACVEVDLVVHGGHGFAVLHDHASIARETTGEGPARAHTAEELRALHLRGNDGVPIPDHVMLLEDLCALLTETPPHPDALLQLDYKEGQGPLDAETVASFVGHVGPLGRSMILSSGEAASVRALADATPGLHIGYDPCHGKAVARVRATGDFPAFVARALAEFPDAEMNYLDHRLILAADDAGYDIVGAFHAAGRRIDAYTIAMADAATLPVIERLLALRVDQITTDDPEGLVARIGAADA
jgi:glycerophosphoryl diester phosphodiesterase